MSLLAFDRATLGQLRGADLELSPGRYVLLSTEREAMASVLNLASGRMPTRAGRVTLSGLAPYASPEVRRQIAALLPDESLPPAKTLTESVTIALAARGSTGVARTLLADVGLERLAEAAPATLGERELRSVALAVALAHDTATLLVIDEPLTTVLPKPLVLNALDRHTARGAIVLAATSSSADATLLGGTWLCLELGRLQTAPARPPRLGSGPWQQLRVTASDARALAQALCASEVELLTEVGRDASTLKVLGPALEITAREVIFHARQQNIEILSMEAAVPPVEALLAARAGFARGAYEAARAAALAEPQSLGPYPQGAG